MRVSKRVIAAAMLIGCLGVTSAFADEPSPKRTRKRAVAKAETPCCAADDIKALKDALQQQQQLMQQQAAQIQALKDDLARQNSSYQQQIDALKANAFNPADLNARVDTAAAKAAAAQAEADKAEAATKAEAADVDNLRKTTASLDRRIKPSEDFLNRWRFSGDMRLREETFFQDQTPGYPRNRVRYRVRLNIDGKLNEQIYGGFSLASGNLADPVSTNVDAQPFFQRKVIGIDKAYITFKPRAAKWFETTGGKWARTWTSTPLTFDNDINFDGFYQRFNFNFKDSPVANIAFNGIELLLNEAFSATVKGAGGADTYAVGGTASITFKLGKRVTITPQYLALNFQNTNALAPRIASGVYSANAQSNRITRDAAGNVTGYASKFLYSNAILDIRISTGNERLPLRLLGEVQDNLRAAHAVPHTAWSTQIALGRARDVKDFQVSYDFYHIGQDAVIAAFADSDFRVPTNLIQNKFIASYVVLPNTTLQYTGFFGRTQDRFLPQPVLAPQVPIGSREHLLSRMQFDIIYKF